MASVGSPCRGDARAAGVWRRVAGPLAAALLGCCLLVCDDTTTEERARQYAFVEYRPSVAKTLLYHVGLEPCTPPLFHTGSDYRFVADSGILYTMYAGSPVLDSSALLFGTVYDNGDRRLRLPAALPYDYDPDGAGGRAGCTVHSVDPSGRVTLTRDTVQFTVGPGERWAFDSTYVETLWTDTSVRCINECTLHDSVVHYGMLEREQIRYAMFPQ